MTTLTLELPEDLAERLALLPEKELSRHIVAYLRAGMDLLDSSKMGQEYKEAVEGIKEGFADLDNGRTIDADTFFDRFEATRRK